MSDPTQEPRLSLIETAIDLAHPPTIALSDEELDRIVATARTLAQLEAKRLGNPIDPRNAVPYAELDARHRVGMRHGARRLLQSLILLGYIDAP